MERSQTSIVAPHAVAIGLLLADAKERAARPTLGEEQKAKVCDKGGLGDGSAPPAVVGGGVVFFPDTRGRLGGVGGGGPAVAGDWRLGITYDDLLTLEGWPHRLRS